MRNKKDKLSGKIFVQLISLINDVNVLSLSRILMHIILL